MKGGLEDALGFPRRREGSAALLSMCSEWVKYRKEWDAERGFFSALRYLCCLGYFFSYVSAQAMSSSPWAFVREALLLDDRQEEWLCSGERRVSQGLL